MHARAPLNLFPLTPHRPHPSPLRTPFLPTHSDPILNRSRETIVLNLFIVFKVHDDVWADELHLIQPKAFRSVACLTSCSPARVSRTSCAHVAPLSLDLTAYSIMFAPRRVRVVGPSCRTIAHVERAKNSRWRRSTSPGSTRSIWLRGDDVLTIYLFLGGIFVTFSLHYVRRGMYVPRLWNNCAALVVNHVI